MGADPTGHDYSHAERVARLARRIAREEQACEFVCVVAGLVHDLCRPLERETGVDHWGPEALRRIAGLLRSCDVNDTTVQDVLICAAEHEDYHFLGKGLPSTRESCVLQDADRLDALGAIGIARAFMYAGAHGQPLGIPDGDVHAWTPHSASRSALGHFEEKLFKLAEGMHTATGKAVAEVRHRFMQDYLERIRLEWEGEA